MIITYYGLSCFKVSSGEFILAFDPPSKKAALKAPRFQADAVLISHNHENHNGYESISAKDGKEPLKISGAGEYEIGPADIKGILSYHDAESGKKYGQNTIYTVSIEDINLCHMGDFGEAELRPEIREGLGRVDILFLPVGGKGVLDLDAAIKISNQIEPRIIIPMHCEKNELNRFLKEIGQNEVKPESRLTLKKKDLPEDKTAVFVLNPAIESK